MNVGFAGYPKYDPAQPFTPLGFGYDSSMMHVARQKDDAPAFMHFAQGAGGLQCRTLDDASLLLYCARVGAENCMEALFAAGLTDDKYSPAELRERCAAEKLARQPAPIPA